MKRKTIKLAIANPKGGVGKSTASANISAVAAMKGLRTLLIDLDPQGSASYLSGVDVAGDRNAGAMFRDNPSLPSVLTYQTKFGYDVLPAGPGLIQAEDWLHNATLGENKLRRLLMKDPALEQYNFIVFDTAGFKGRLLDSALIACTDVLIPGEASVLTLNEIPEFYEMINHISEVREGVGEAPLTVKGLVFNKVREGTSAVEKAIMQALEALEFLNETSQQKMNALSTFIPISNAIEEAGFARKPVVVMRPKEKVSIRYNELFDELFAKENEADVCPV